MDASLFEPFFNFSAAMAIGVAAFRFTALRRARPAQPDAQWMVRAALAVLMLAAMAVGVVVGQHWLTFALLPACWFVARGDAAPRKPQPRVDAAHAANESFWHEPFPSLS